MVDDTRVETTLITGAVLYSSNLMKLTTATAAIKVVVNFCAA